MADRKCIVRRRITSSEAGTAEGGLHNGAGLHQVCHRSVFHQFHIDRRAGRIYAEGKFIRSDIMSADDVRRRTDIFKTAAGTSGDDSLVYI